MWNSLAILQKKKMAKYVVLIALVILQVTCYVNARGTYINNN